MSEYWLRLDGGHGYFVRFASHVPPRWFTTHRLSTAYCFASVADAQHVADQLRAYKRGATVVTRKSAPPPPPIRRAAFLSEPPESCRTWVSAILNAAAGHSPPDAPLEDRIKAGHRTLARQHHPDRGGDTADMQLLGEAVAWLRQNNAFAAMWFTTSFPAATTEAWDDDDIPF